MLKDITLGQYFPGNSFIHRLDPRTKLIFLVLYIVALFLVKTWVGYAIMLALLITVSAIARVKPSALLRGMKPLTIIIIFTAVINLFYYREGQVLVQFWVLTITTDGLIRSGYMVLRIMLLVCGTFLLTYTTTPMSLTDGLELLLGPLKKIKVPVHELSMMMSIALRFIPTLIEEADKIMNAQKARGADFESGGLIARAKALVPLLVPLFVSAFRRADELATAMEARCYNGGEGRTRMNTLRMKASDWLVLLLGAVIVGVIVVLGCFGL